MLGPPGAGPRSERATGRDKRGNVKRGRYVVIVGGVYAYDRRVGRASSVRRARKIAYKAACKFSPYSRRADVWIERRPEKGAPVNSDGRRLGRVVDYCEREFMAARRYVRSLPTVADVGYW